MFHRITCQNNIGFVRLMLLPHMM